MIHDRVRAWRAWRDAWDALEHADQGMGKHAYFLLILAERRARENYRLACGGMSLEAAHRSTVSDDYDDFGRQPVPVWNL